MSAHGRECADDCVHPDHRHDVVVGRSGTVYCGECFAPLLGDRQHILDHRQCAHVWHAVTTRCVFCDAPYDPASGRESYCHPNAIDKLRQWAAGLPIIDSDAPLSERGFGT